MRATIIQIGVTLVIAAGVGFVDSSGAAVLCARKGKIKVRETTCKSNETLLQDVSAQQATLDSTIDGLPALTARVDALDKEFQLTCPGAPHLAFADAPAFSFRHAPADCRGGCRLHDGNETACKGAFAASRSGATSCVYVDGQCVPCVDCANGRGTCVNACVAPLACADPTRTQFLPRNARCTVAKTEEQCDISYHVGRTGVASCYWDGSRCRGCGYRQANQGACSDTCSTPPICADASRVTRGRCDVEGANPGACAARWYFSGRDLAATSCYHDGSRCRPCTVQRQLAGDCTNTCRAGS